MGRFAFFFLAAAPLFAQQPQLQYLNHNRPLVDAHNCYPYDGKWANRIDRALKAGFPVAIEQDLALYVDPKTGEGRVVVSHTTKTTASDPTLQDYFFKRVRPIVEKALASGDRSRWPLIVLHFDFKETQPALLHAVWKVLGQHRSWITTAVKGKDPHTLEPLDVKPLLVITEDSDAQAKVFFNEVPVGARLRLFGSAHTNMPHAASNEEQNRLLVTLPPSKLLTARPTDYRRWWNNSWYVVEEGGAPNAGPWTAADDARLKALVDYAHHLGYWIRFYTLDGFTPAVGRENGWFSGYNFGSPSAAKKRWKAAIDAGVNFIATDQYGALAKFMRSQK
ncbi:MAG TPA: hypothetical protein VF283_16630 [Bryobacteraceae bacterium]